MKKKTTWYEDEKRERKPPKVIQLFERNARTPKEIEDSLDEEFA